MSHILHHVHVDAAERFLRSGCFFEAWGNAAIVVGGLAQGDKLPAGQWSRVAVVLRRLDEERQRHVDQGGMPPCW